MFTIFKSFKNTLIIVQFFIELSGVMSLDNPLHPNTSSNDDSSSADEDDSNFYEEWNDIKILKEIVKNVEDEKYSLDHIRLYLEEEYLKREKLKEGEFVDGYMSWSFIGPKPAIRNLLEFIQIEPPKEGKKSWVIPSALSCEDLFAKSCFIIDIINKDLDFDEVLVYDISNICNVPKFLKLTNISRCKVCKWKCKSLKQHLHRAKKCRASYSESDMKDINEKLQEISKAKKKQLNAESYQRNKSDMAKYYKENKAEIIKKRHEHYRKNKSKVKKSSMKYYKKHRPEYAKKRAEYYLKNQDHLRAKTKKWRDDDEERTRISLENSRRESNRNRFIEYITSFEQEARGLNKKMKEQFIFTRGHEMKILSEIGISHKMKETFEDIEKIIDQIYNYFETHIDELIKNFNDEINDDKDHSKTFDATEEKFNRLLQVNFHAKSSKAIYNEYNIIYILADDTLKTLSDEMKRSLSYSQKCNGLTTHTHFKDEVFPGKCILCSGKHDEWVGLPFKERIKKVKEFLHGTSTSEPAVMKENKNYIRKRKPVDFTMSDLEEDEDDEYKP